MAAAEGREVGVPHLSLVSLFGRFLGFGLSAWGGPVAQIAMLRRELVDRDRWMSSERFNRTLAVYQALPGPEAHELCVHFGYLARGRIGGLLAGLGFMLPGFLLMLAASWFYVTVGIDSPLFTAAFAGCQAAVLALIVRAVARIGSHAVHDRWLFAIALLAAAATFLGLNFVLVLGSAGAVYLVVARGGPALATVMLVAAAGGLVAVGIGREPAVAPGEPEPSAGSTVLTEPTPAELLGSGLRAGLLTFGGAYTAIPILERDAVDNGRWMTGQTFLDGVALSGILPAPLIIFATFVGFAAGGWVGAIVMTLGVFGPAFGFTLLGYSHLERLVQRQSVHAFLDGVTAGVVGLIGATAVLLAPTAVGGFASAAIFGVALLALFAWRSRIAVAAVVLGAGVLGILFFGLTALPG